MKRVACLYRVSTKGQVDKDDIPMQRKECSEFIKKQGWQLVNEYYEKGVSGYKKSADQRDVLQTIKNDALNNQFDILLVYMFDRLGRREDETPFILEWFTKQGIEMWSVKEGQQSFSQHIDKLLNYIRFWQASGESYKTSMRVDSSHRQMAEEGKFRGGDAPYGYMLVKTGVFNKKKKELLKLIINTIEAPIVQLIYKLALEGYGQTKIAKHLNEHGIKTRNNKMWNSGTIGYILKNPIYKGYPAYRKKTGQGEGVHNLPSSEWILSSTQQIELVIISENDWDRVQELRTQHHNSPNYNTITNSPLLLVGLTYCGCCKSPLTTTYSYKYNKDKTKVYQRPKYRCSGKANAKALCDGQTVYSAEKYEKAVLNQIDIYLNKIKNTPQSQQDTTANDFQKNIKSLENKLAKINNMIEILSDEVGNALIGESRFTPEILAEQINKKQQDKMLIQNELDKIKQEADNYNHEQINTQQLNQVLPVWKERFDGFSTEKKKRLLRILISRIEFNRDTIIIDFNTTIQCFLDAIAA